jgi:hypothetical protein
MKEQHKDIKIFGVGTPKDRALMITVWAAARKLDMPVNIVFVSDLDQILKSGALAIPALVIEGKIVSEGELPSAPEIISILQKFFA